MFKHLFAFLSLLVTLSAFAAEIPVMEVNTSTIRYNKVETKILVDLQTGEGSVELKLQHVTHRGRGGRHVKTVLTKVSKVEGLFLQGDKLIFRGETADVDCGTMGLSRVFKVPTLFLTGNCDVKAVKGEKPLKVSFVTK